MGLVMLWRLVQVNASSKIEGNTGIQLNSYKRVPCMAAVAQVTDLWHTRSTDEVPHMSNDLSQWGFAKPKGPTAD